MDSCCIAVSDEGPLLLANRSKDRSTKGSKTVPNSSIQGNYANGHTLEKSQLMRCYFMYLDVDSIIAAVEAMACYVTLGRFNNRH